MKAANDNHRLEHDPFAGLPMFISDQEIAKAIVGARRADGWLKDKFPHLVRRADFPQKDEFHGGWAVAKIKRFYIKYLGLNLDNPDWTEDGEEGFGQWNGRKKSRRIQ